MEHKDVNKYAYLDQLSTRELQELLRADVDSPESGDDEAIFYILEVMKKRERADPSDASSDLDRCWNEFQTVYNTPEGKDSSLYPMDEAALRALEPRPRKRRRLRRILLAAAAAALALSLAIPVTGYDSILEMIGALTMEQFTIISAGSDTDESSEEFEGAQVFESAVGDKLRQTLVEYGITEQVVPHWLPEKFKMHGEVSIREFNGSNDIQFSVFYSDGADYLSINISQRYRSGNGIYEKTDDEPETYVVEGTEHHIFKNSNNMDTLTAVWNCGTLECAINTTLPESDLKMVIDSIYEE